METTHAQELVNAQIRQHRQAIQRQVEELKTDVERFLYSSVAYSVARDGEFVYHVNTPTRRGTLRMRYTIRALRKAGFKVELSVAYGKDYEWRVTVTLP